MFDFQNKEHVLPSALILLAILILTGSALYDILVPSPGGPAAGHDRVMARRKLADDMFMAKSSEKKAKSALEPKLWQGTPDAVAAGVLAQITTQANRRGLTLGAFRPERSVSLGIITELPYSVQVTGPYPNIRAVLSALDGPNSKVILRSIQLASSEQSSNVVAATLGVSAYLATDPLVASSPQSIRVQAGTANHGQADRPTRTLAARERKLAKAEVGGYYG